MRMFARALNVGVAGVLFAVAAWAQVSTETVEGVTNFRQVKSTVACAGATTPEAMRGIKGMGFVSVVNLRRRQEGANARRNRGGVDRRP